MRHLYVIMAKLTFLGTGTSTGVPQIGCDCDVCRSRDPRDNRLRCSALLTLDDGRGLLIDCGPDFRAQALSRHIPDISALLLTHVHYDHVGGIDDLRPYTYRRLPEGLPVYCRRDVAAALRAQMPYAFVENEFLGVPRLELHEIAEGEPFQLLGLDIEPLAVNHFQLPILGFRIGRFAYVTDCKTMPDSTLRRLEGVDTLVINALRRKPHVSHMNLEQALDVIHMARPREAYLTHLSHDMGLHAAVEPELPQGVRIAYDGLTINVPVT